MFVIGGEGCEDCNLFVSIRYDYLVSTKYVDLNGNPLTHLDDSVAVGVEHLAEFGRILLHQTTVALRLVTRGREQGC